MAVMVNTNSRTQKIVQQGNNAVCVGTYIYKRLAGMLQQNSTNILSECVYFIHLVYDEDPEFALYKIK
jgi:hypothetical protein